MRYGEMEALTMIHDVIPANSTVVDHDIPCPQCYGIPLLHKDIIPNQDGSRSVGHRLHSEARLGN